VIKESNAAAPHYFTAIRHSHEEGSSLLLPLTHFSKTDVILNHLYHSSLVSPTKGPPKDQPTMNKAKQQHSFA
jgi:hypothetical protein